MYDRFAVHTLANFIITGEKHNGTLLYTVRPIQEAVEYRYQQQLKHFEAEMYRQKTLARIEKLYGDQGSRKKQEKA